MFVEAGTRTDFLPPVEPREVQSECGLYGAYFLSGHSIDVPEHAYKALLALQHRAEDAAGMVISDGETFQSIRKKGTVNVVFEQGQRLPHLRSAKIVIAHTRYPTSGTSDSIHNIQPLNVGDRLWGGHHGNLTNGAEIRDNLGLVFTPDAPNSDSFAAMNLIDQAEGESLDAKVKYARKFFEGGFAMIFTDGKQLVGTRDGYGIRPLSAAYIKTEGNVIGYALSVESSAFKSLHVPEEDIWELLPGETVVIDDAGIRTIDYSPQGKNQCKFEFIYMMRPDSIFMGKTVYEVRRRAGGLLWHEQPVIPEDEEILTFMGVPNSGRPAGEAYYEEAKEELGNQARWEELIFSESNERGFIKSTEHREKYEKFYVIPERVKGKSLVVVDDSIVRGDTAEKLIRLLLDAGAKKVHLRSASPPIRFPCLLGIAMADVENFAALKFPDLSERAAYLGVASLGYLSIKGLVEATGNPYERFCTICLDGHGPPIKEAKPIKLDESTLSRGELIYSSPDS